MNEEKKNKKRKASSIEEQLKNLKAKVRVHRYCDRRLAVFHGPRKLAVYDSKGKITGDAFSKNSGSLTAAVSLPFTASVNPAPCQGQASQARCCAALTSPRH